MARPKKEGMDYFPHDTDAMNDEKIEALRMLYGNDGYAFYFILLERIYRNKNAELDVSDAETKQILSRKIGISNELFAEILETCLKRKCFDREEYEKNGILTSEGIKNRALPVIKKRAAMRNKYKEIVSDAETEQKPDKVKESKVKESIKDIVEYLNEKSGKSFKASNQATQEFINARLNDGYTIDDFKKVIDTKVKEWTGTDQEQYIRPNTLFRPSNFEAYLNQKSKVVSMDKQKDFVKNQMESRDQEYPPNYGGVK